MMKEKQQHRVAITRVRQYIRELANDDVPVARLRELPVAHHTNT